MKIFTIEEIRKWLTAQGYSEGIVEDKIEELIRYAEDMRNDEQ